MNSGYALITGASNGIGKALAEDCAKRGMNLLLVSLAKTGLQEVAEDLRSNYGVEVKIYEADLTVKAQIDGLYNYINANNIRLTALINNAGVGYEASFETLSPEFCEKMMLLNTQAVVILTRMFIDNLRQNEQAYILNVSSISAFTIVPYKTMYVASKAFIYSFSRGLRIELKNSPVSVSVLCPGPVPTNQEIKDRIKSHGGFGALMTMEPEKLAEVAISSMLKGKAVIIPGIWNKFGMVMMSMLPKVFQGFLMSRHFNSVQNTKKEVSVAA
jgi:short-subunit dehydrogenase